MIDESQARAVAEAVVASFDERRAGGPLMITEVEERPIGWIFYYQKARYVETGDWRDMMAGNAPILVDRITGEAHITGTAHPVDHYITEYEARRRPPQ